jgi:hypothetical protein
VAVKLSILPLQLLCKGSRFDDLEVRSQPEFRQLMLNVPINLRYHISLSLSKLILHFYEVSSGFQVIDRRYLNRFRPNNSPSIVKRFEGWLL